MIKAIGYAAKQKSAPLEPFSFERRGLGDYDVQISILYCGVCHTDISFINDGWNISKYPMVPGHEIIGKVTHIGKKITNFTIGDIVLPLGTVDSCGICDMCKKTLYLYCQNGYTFIYNSVDKYTGNINYGGFSNIIIVNEKFIVHVPENLLSFGLPSIAPLICAGITTYAALKHHNIGKGKKVGIVGIGGLGHLAVKFAHALGAHVVAITTTPDKKIDAKKLGADEAILSTNSHEMEQHNNSFDLIISTIPEVYDVNPYINLLTYQGIFHILGMVEEPVPIILNEIGWKEKIITGSRIGSVDEIKEMLNFCIENNITTDVEIIPIQKINEAFKNIIDKKVRYRYVIDMSSL